MSSTAARKRYRERHPERDKKARREAKARWIARNPEKYAESNRLRAAAYRKKNPEKVKAGLRDWYARNPLKVKDSRLRKTFGITLEFWNGMFAAQGRVCACCGSTDPKSKKGWQTDHCHSSGIVRGILCQPCNMVLAEDITPARLDQMKSYLQKHEWAQ
jgi:hypothetical protein